MKKLFAIFALAVTALLAQPLEVRADFLPGIAKYGYFYLTDNQTVFSQDLISWENAGSVNTSDIYINPEDAREILITHPGTYLITYNLTVANTSNNSDVGDAQFTLAANEIFVPGSIYAVGNALVNSESQLAGQAIVKLDTHFSKISLHNRCENTIILHSDVGTDNPDEFGQNVSASIIIRKIGLPLEI